MYTIARPDKNGVPVINLSGECIQPEYSHDVVYSGETQVKIDRVLMKVISEQTPFKPMISERLRSLMKAKLWRMGKALHNKNSKRQIILQQWRGMEWELSLKPLEALLQEKENLQFQLDSERKTSAKLAEEVEGVMKANVVLIEQNNTMRKQQERLSVNEHHVRKRKARKSWGEYSQQHKRQKLQQVKDAVDSVLCDENLEVIDVTVKDKQSDSMLNLADKHPHVPSTDDNSNILNLLLYAKERFRISDSAYHELSMLFPVLPRTCQVKQRVKELNEQWEIYPTPEGSLGVQQSLKKQQIARVEHLLHISPMNAPFRSSGLIRVKLTGDSTNTNIGKLHVVTFGFTIPEAGMGAKSAAGNYPLCIIKDTEDYEQLKISLSDVLKDIQDIHT